MRIKSIDGMRGVVVLTWLLCELALPTLNRFPDNPVRNAIEAQLTPSFWDGTTLRDLVLPLFCFILGVSIVPAFQKRKAMGRSNSDLALRVVRRVLCLFVIGLACEGGVFQHWPHLRLVGVFQRIALCYAAGACLELWTGWRLQAGLAAFLLLGYGVILALNVGGSVPSNPFSLEHNVAATVDEFLLPGRKYFANWDQDGILTTIPAIAVSIAGLVAGKALTAPRSPQNWLSMWFIGFGIVAFNLAFVVDPVLPINPYLWTSSFCFLSIGVGLILLGGFHAVLDVPNKNGWAGPLVALGRNTLVVVIGVSTLGRSLAFLRFLSPTIRKVCPDTASSAFYGIVIVLVVGGAAIWLDRRNTYLTA